MSGQPVNSGQSYRIYSWTTRVLAIACVVLGAIVALQAAALVKMAPLKTVEPMLLRAAPESNQVLRVEPFAKGALGLDLFAETKAREYVVKRETIDLQTEPQRWQEVEWMSSVDIWTTFRNEMDPRRNNESPFAVAEDRGLTRQIKPLLAAQISDNQIQVEFERTDYERATGEQLGQTRTFVATITYDFVGQAVHVEDKYMNPLGWQVVAYGLHEKSR